MPRPGHRLGDPGCSTAAARQPSRRRPSSRRRRASCNSERVLDDAQRPVPLRVRLHHHAYRLYGPCPARRFTPPATQLYGAEAVAESPRLYGTTSKGAQEAHEGSVPPTTTSARRARWRLLSAAAAGAVRPDPKRTVARRGFDAVGYTATIRVLTRHRGTTVSVTTCCPAFGQGHTLPGFAYQEGRDQGR